MGIPRSAQIGRHGRYEVKGLRTACFAALPTSDHVVRPSMRRARDRPSQRSAARRQTRTQWSTASMNVLLEAPPSEQSVHVAVHMLLLLHQLSCCFAGHALNGNAHDCHGTLTGSSTAYRTSNAAAEGSFHGLSMGVNAWPSYALSGVRDGWHACVHFTDVRRAMLMNGRM